MTQYYHVDEKKPPIDVEVLAGFWYKDTWLIEEKAWRFMVGVCYARETDDLRNFPCGYQWQTFGPSHNQIKYWTHLPTPPERMLE